MLIDTHCHLTDERMYGDIEGILRRAKKAGVEKIIVPSTSLEDAEKVIEIADKYKGVYGLVGIHPEIISNEEFLISNQIPMIKYQLTKFFKSSKKIVGIGEVGLDFYYDKEKKTKDRQIELFKAQLELAMELGLPVAIHAREAEGEIRYLLDEYVILPKGQFHCFGGSEDFLSYVLKKGFYVSFCGNITYKNKRSLSKTDPTSEESALNAATQAAKPSDERSSLRDLLRLVPVNRLLLETDSPYLTPEPMRGKTNEPANVKITAQFMADILGVDPGSLINQIRKNSLCLYSLEK